MTGILVSKISVTFIWELHQLSVVTMISIVGSEKVGITADFNIRKDHTSAVVLIKLDAELSIGEAFDMMQDVLRKICCPNKESGSFAEVLDLTYCEGLVCDSAFLG